MKKFFVVTIILFFMSNFSTVQTNSISNDDTNNTSKLSHTTMRNYFDELEKWIPENERPKKKVLEDNTSKDIQKPRTIRDLFNEEKPIRSWHDVAQAEKLQQKSEKSLITLFFL